MVFAQRVQLDVLDQHHFAVVGAEQGTVGDLFQCLFIAAAEVLHGFGGTFWRVEQAFAGGILAQLAKDRGVILFQGHETTCGILRKGQGYGDGHDAASVTRQLYSSRPSIMVRLSIT
ncbi:hypothetical protein D9M71_754130 [compost metagenome]